MAPIFDSYLTDEEIEELDLVFQEEREMQFLVNMENSGAEQLEQPTFPEPCQSENRPHLQNQILNGTRTNSSTTKTYSSY